MTTSWLCKVDDVNWTYHKNEITDLFLIWSLPNRPKLRTSEIIKIVVQKLCSPLYWVFEVYGFRTERIGIRSGIFIGNARLPNYNDENMEDILKFL